ncbi:MAG: pirin family protein [Aquificota bacterium]|nr:pirin family protein [Aquificota bacterium]
MRVFPAVEVVDGAGVRIRRYIGVLPREIDPFLLLDEIKSSDPEDYRAGFPPHPHRGFQTITYMIKGKFKHKDSSGGEGVLEEGPGSVDERG